MPQSVECSEALLVRILDRQKTVIRHMCASLNISSDRLLHPDVTSHGEFKLALSSVATSLQRVQFTIKRVEV